ncbi:MAG: hypothetical protein EA352_00215 [Gemmatimonadales bacterium]|nr:MAG: hypothetical protein EA352_00215 [Gemmatimonadales bacterium]
MPHADPFLQDESRTDASSAESGAEAPAGGVRPLSPAQLSRWLEEHQEAIAHRWFVEVRARGEGVDGPVAQVMEEFLELLVGFLPLGVGPLRDQVEPIYQQAAELYGNLGALRGLAAGESVEEVQLLREVLLRFLYRQPPSGGSAGPAAMGLREFLRLNRMVDLCVTQASVGHTDTLFFNLLHESGVTGAGTERALEGTRSQIAAFREELERLSAILDPEGHGLAAN